MAVVAVAVAVVLLLPPVRAAPSPTTGQYFEFDDNTYLTNGQGNYSGYSEQETAHYRYTVQSVAADNVTLFGSGDWSWTNSTIAPVNGNWAATFSFSTTTRLYTQGFDVLGQFTRPYVWFWVPSGLKVGQIVPILDDNLTVVSLSSTVWLGNFPPTPRVGVELQSTGAFVRNDVYGLFDASYTDRYWFDPATGFVIAEYYDETDSASQGGFEWQEQVFTTTASFPITLDYAQLAAVYGGIPAIPVVIFLIVRQRKSGPRRIRTTVPGGTGRATARRIRRLHRLGDRKLPDSLSFAPFARTAVRRALGLRDPVYLATDNGHLAGVYVYDKGDKVGSIVATEPAVVTTFLSMRKGRSLFIEMPKGTPGVVPPGTTEIGRYDVYELDSPTAQPFDGSRVRPMLPGDLPAVVHLAEKVYVVPQVRQLRSAVADGDVAFVATGPMGIEGFALATIGDDAALFHGLTVDPTARNSGLGNELTAARLCAVAALGVRKVRVEIARGNAPPARIAQRFGFEKVGEIVYTTRRPGEALDLAGRPAS